jgi:hypothetical protein
VCVCVCVCTRARMCLIWSPVSLTFKPVDWFLLNLVSYHNVSQQMPTIHQPQQCYNTWTATCFAPYCSIIRECRGALRILSSTPQCSEDIQTNKPLQLECTNSPTINHTLTNLWQFCYILLNVKVKVTLVHALRLCTGRTAHRGSRRILVALLFHDHGTRRGWGFSVTPRPLFTPGKVPVHIVQEVWWTPRPLCTGVANFAPTPGFDPRTVEPVASHYTNWATQPTLHNDGWQNG